MAQNRGNVGIAGRPDDALILVDIDDPEIEDELKDTLKTRSRSRSGTHAIYWADPDDDILPLNIPTDQGEVRSSDQYVVAPGSFVPCTEEQLTAKVEDGQLAEEQKQEILEDPQRGYYTIDTDKRIATITFNELPEVFREQYLQAKSREESRQREETTKTDYDDEASSAIYSLDVADLTSKGDMRSSLALRPVAVS